jgi:hypothetical protein
MKSFCQSLTAALLMVGISAPVALAGELNADPSTYVSQVAQLQAGDTLHLAAGDYGVLVLSGLQGTAGSPITIAGPDSGPPARFLANPCCNTVEIRNSSYLVLQHLTVDAQHLDGTFGVSAKDGLNNLVHHITIENCTFLNHDGSQQHVAISTKTPTWGWVIRGNTLLNPGTGLYLGNSDGTDPFVGGVIENNLVQNPIGYCMEIKFQLPRPAISGMPTGTASTLIRNNVFIKNDQPSPDGDRPNLLVGGFPDSGPGSNDLYEIYGNFVFHNPRESLIQASGRVTIHDNILVDTTQTALLLRDHDLPLKLAHVYNNTVYSAAQGIFFGSVARQGDAVVGNLVFAATPISGSITTQTANLTNSVANAGQYVSQPSLTLGAMDFYPLPNRVTGSPLDLTAFSSETDYALDFNQASKAPFLFRGAYAGEGSNPGWPLGAGVKDLSSSSIPDPGQPSTPPSGGTPTVGNNPAGPSSLGPVRSSCSQVGGTPFSLLFPLLAAGILRRRR